MTLEGFLGWICQPGLVTTGIKGKVFPPRKLNSYWMQNILFSFRMKMRRLVTTSFLTSNAFAFVIVVVVVIVIVIARIANAVQVTI